MSDIVYIGEQSPCQQHAGGKAVEDVECVLNGVYSKLTTLYTMPGRRELFNYAKTFCHNYSCLAEIEKNCKNRVIIIQYPHYNYSSLLKEKLYTILSNNKTILLVHDVNSIRFNGDIRKEIDILNKACVVILHSQNMADYLKERGLTVSTVNLNMFDYLLGGLPSQENYHLGKEIVFAGNLGKSKFLTELAKENALGLSLNLYGPNLDANLKNKVHWLGSYSPDEIPFKLQGSFGLVWDGNSVHGCTGFIGDYLKVNYPHKLSLYIAAGIPVITWKRAAIAQIVEDYNIGFTVDSLSEISANIDLLHKDDYQMYLQNVANLQKKTISGVSTRSAFEEAVIIASKG